MTVAYLTGPDLSHYQGPAVDFGVLGRSHHSFAILKATEGSYFTDPQFAANRAKAHASGLYVGLYHFARATDPVAEANYFADVVGGAGSGEWAATDEEVYSADPPAWVGAFDGRVRQRLGLLPWTYLNQWARDQWNWSPVAATGSPLWLAKYDGVYSDQPGGPGAWPHVTMEQYTDKGVCPGVPGLCDMNVFYGSEADLAALTHPRPTPAKDWFDMATKADLAAVIDERLDALFKADPLDSKANARRDPLLNRMLAIMQNPKSTGTIFDLAKRIATKLGA